MRKPTIGEQLYFVNDDRYSKKAEYCTVEKVGRKYFSVKLKGSRHTYQFYIENWRRKTEYSSTVTLYENEQEYEDSLEKQKWKNVFRQAFDNYFRNKKFSLDQYRDAAKILGLQLEEK